MSKISENITALKIASRSMKRNRLQSFLIIAIIALPVFVAGTYLTLGESTKATSQELIKYQLGAAVAEYEVQVKPGKNWTQSPEELRLVSISDSWQESTEPKVDIQDALPNVKLLPINHTQVVFKTAAGVGSIEVFEGQSWNAAFLNRGPIELVEGTTPKSDSEAMLSPTALKRFGVKLGDKIETTEGTAFKVVGTLKNPSTSSTADIVYVQNLGEIPQMGSGFVYFKLDGNAPNWEQVQKLNKLGVAVLSKSVLENPPPSDQIPVHSPNSLAFSYSLMLMLVIFPIILLPIVVLAGSAFAFGARRQSKTLAVMASLGASRKTLRKVTVASGVWLGLLGGLSGAALAAVFVWAFGPALLTQSFELQPSWQQYPGFHVPWALLIGIIIGSVILGALSSYLPARKASRVNILATLRGQRTESQVRARSGIGALLLLAGGVALIIACASLLFWANAQTSTNLGYVETLETYKKIGVYGQIIGGFMAVLGFIVGRGWIISGLRQVLSQMGKKSNFAGRDLLFNRSRYAPVLSSVLVVYFLSAFVLGVSYGPMIGQQLELQRMQPYLPGQYEYNLLGRVYLPEVKDGDLTPKIVEDSWPSDSYIAGAVNDFEQTKAFQKVAVIKSTLDYSSNGMWSHDQTGNFIDAFDVSSPHVILNPESLCYYVGSSPHNAEFLKTHKSLTHADMNTPAGCSSGDDPKRTIVVGNAKTLGVIANRFDQKAVDTLNNGGVVLFNNLYDFGGIAKIRWAKESEYTYDDQFKIANVDRSEDLESYVIPGIDSPRFAYGAMISEATATKLGIKAFPVAIMGISEKPLSTSVTDALSNKGVYLESFRANAGYEPNTFAWFIALAAGAFALLSIGIALGLSQIEAAADKKTLAAIGAPRSFRAGMVARQALALTITGALLGGGAGLLLGISLASSSTYEGSNVLPWAQLLTLLLGIPLFASLAFWVFTPRKLAYEARQALD